jgi:HD-GYP domain-containing protein (c-di-GMP phosphodiesterase class II)
VGYVAETGRSLLAADVSRESRYRFYEGLPDARSEAVVPIVSGGSLVGVLDVQSEHIGGLEESDLQVLETLAVGAGRALENARLFGETHQRLRELEAVNRVSTALRVAQTLDEMLPILLDETLRALDAGVGSIALYEPSANGLRQVVARGWMRVPAARVAHAGQGLLGLTYSGGQPLVSREFAVDSRGSEPLWSPVPPGWGGVLVPVRTAQGIIGILTVAVQLPREVQQYEVRLLVTLAEIAGNAIHRTRLHEQTQQNVQRLLALHTVDMAISASVDLGVTLSVLLEQVTSLLHVDYADILVLDPTTQSLEVAAGLGVARVFRQARPLKLGEGIAGRAAAEARTIVLWDLDAEAARAGEEGSPRGIAPRDWAGDSQIAALLAEGFGSYCAVPVVAKGQVKGVLEVLSRSVLAPDQAWLDFLQALCAQAAIAIDSSALFSGLQRSNLDLSMAYDTTLEGWARALELRDRETEGHTQRVADLTVRLARAMGMPEAELVHLRRGALLHDIGKMGVPDSVLLKPGPLTEEEWAIMRQHPTHAYQLLSPITFLKPALDVPYCHHEKWDGSGYPRGLKAEQIPLSARIFAIVDVWDALRSDRPYRKAWSAQRARDYIRDQSGTHFDPAVVDAFLAMRLEAQA